MNKSSYTIRNENAKTIKVGDKVYFGDLVGVAMSDCSIDGTVSVLIDPPYGCIETGNKTLTFYDYEDEP